MNEEARIEDYAGLWTRLNVVNALISELEAERAAIKARQRALANGLVNGRLELLRQAQQEEGGSPP